MLCLDLFSRWFSFNIYFKSTEQTDPLPPATGSKIMYYGPAMFVVTHMAEMILLMMWIGAVQ